MGIASSRQEVFWECCGYGHTEIVQKFLEDKSIDVNWVSYTHDSCPIHVAANGKTEIVKLLLKANADVNKRDINGCLALHHAAMQGHADITELLLKGGSMLDAQDKNDWTALNKAAYFCKPDVVDLLLQKNGDVQLKNSEGRAPLHEACRSQSKDEEGLGRIAQALIDAGSDLNSKSFDVGAADFTPLMFCGYHGHTEIGKALIQAGCDLNAQGSNGWTALHWAVDRNNKEMVKILLDAGVDPLIEGTRGELCIDRALTAEVRNILNNQEVDPLCPSVGAAVPLTDVEAKLKAINDSIMLKSMQNQVLARSNSMLLSPEEVHAMDRRSPVSTNDGSESERSLPATPEPSRRNSAATTSYDQLPPRRVQRKPRHFPGRGDTPPKAEPEDEGDIMFADDEDDEDTPVPLTNGHAEFNGNAALAEAEDLDDLINDNDFKEDLMF